MNVNIEGLGLVSGALPVAGALPKNMPQTTATRTNNQVFEDFLKAAEGIYTETNKTLNDYENFQLKIATGESDDFIGLTLMQSKASASMQFIVQSTNKAVEAYREIMRMQV